MDFLSFIVESLEFFIYSRYQTLVEDVDCKHFLQICGLFILFENLTSFSFWLHRVLVVAFALLIASLVAQRHMGSCRMWDLSSLTRDQTCVPSTGRQILNLWTTGEVPKVSYYRKFGTCFCLITRHNIALKCVAIAVFFRAQ